jgi:integrase
MKVTKDKQSGKYRIIIPPKWSGTAKRQVRFFDSKSTAEAKATEITRNRGIDPAEDLSDDALAFLQLVKTDYAGDFNKALESLSQHRRMMATLKKPSATIHEACLAFQAHQEDTGKHPVTRRKYRSTLNRFCIDVSPKLPIVEVTEEMITDVYFKRFKTSGTRKSQWSNLHAFFKWAMKKGYVSSHPLANAERLDKWKSKKGFLAVEDFRRILFACAERFPRLLPYFVLGGLAGLRRCELISSQPIEQDPRIEWRDVDFKNGKIRIRHEVAKETLADDRRRTIPLEPAAREWLQLVSKSEGPVIAISQSTLQREKAVLLDELGLKVPENALRNSYASYGASFRSLGDVARALGDTEVTAKRYYVDVGIDDPELGRAWFSIRPDSARKIVPMVA